MEPEFPSYLKPLLYRRHNYPHSAMEAAEANLEESIPHLVRGIESACDDPWAGGPEGEPYMLHIFAMFLLAQFREKSALSAVVLPGRNPEIETLLGDCVTEDLARVLASVCGDDTGPVRELVEVREAYEFARAAGFEALEFVMAGGRLSRGECSEYVGYLAATLPREQHYLWDAVCCACAQCQLTGYLQDVRKAYADGLASPLHEKLEWIEEEMMGKVPLVRAPREMVTDAVGETQGWAPGFREQPSSHDEGDHTEVQAPKIGRNDPAPCGSGKKSKKCCL